MMVSVVFEVNKLLLFSITHIRTLTHTHAHTHTHKHTRSYTQTLKQIGNSEVDL